MNDDRWKSINLKQLPILIINENIKEITVNCRKIVFKMHASNASDTCNTIKNNNGKT